MKARTHAVRLVLSLALLGTSPAHAIEEMWRMRETGGTPSYDRGAHVLVGPFTDHNGDGRVDLAGDGPDVIVIGSAGTTSPLTQVRVLDARTGLDLRRFVNSPFAADGPDRGTVPAIGDLDADGFPELVFADGPFNRTVIHAFNSDGSLKWTTRFLAEFATVDHRGITVADVDGDGLGEVLAGKTVVNHDGSLRAVLQLDACNVSYPLDLDLDGTPEIVCGGAAARIDGSVFFPGEGGADSIPAATAMADIRWFRGRFSMMPLPTCRTCPSAKLPPPPFSESGTLAALDGMLTLLHPNLDGLHALDARTGSERFFIPQPNATAEELPLFVDLDGDGHGEIVLKSVNDPTIGVRVFRDPSWCDARPIWNQSHFVPDWIGDDMRPTFPWATPIDWITVGTRMQQDLCPCAAVGAAAIEVVRTCVNGESCASATVPGASGALTYSWTLPAR